MAKVMRSQQSHFSPLPTALLCTKCSNRVNQPPGTRRTICPFCGGFFNDEAKCVSLEHLNGIAGYQNEMEPTSFGREQSCSSSSIPAANEFSAKKKKVSKLSKRKSSVNGSESASGERRGSNSFIQFFTLGKSKKRNEGNTSSSNKIQSKNVEGKVNTSALPPVCPTHAKDSKYPAGVTLMSLKMAFEEAISTNQWNVLTKRLIKGHKNFDWYHTLMGSAKENGVKPGNLNTYRCNLQVADDVHQLLNSMPTVLKKKICMEMMSLLIINNISSDEITLKGHALLLMNPLFDHSYSYCTFSHLLRNIHSWEQQRQCHFMSMMKKLQLERIRSIIRRLHNFISSRMFPSQSTELPSVAKSGWWVPSAVKVLALFYAAFASCKPSDLSNAVNVTSLSDSGRLTTWLHYTEFYNDSIDMIDLAAEYALWQNNAVRGFNFCQYPFILSVLAKKSILQYDSEQKMLLNARRTLVAQVRNRETPDMEQVFLNISVRRAHLVADSLVQLLQKSHDFKKKLRITFVGEPGLDYGGVKKEWFLLMVRKLFRATNGLFTHDKKTQAFWFAAKTTANREEYRLAGVLMGLAMYNSINLDLHFPTICYKKLLSPVKAPASSNNVDLGICPVTLEDLKEVKHDFACGLEKLLLHEGNVEDDLCMAFQCSFEDANEAVTFDLKPNGNQILVNNDNRQEYVDLCCDLILNKTIKESFKAFYLGFHSVCASNALILLRPEEIEYLVCGSTNFDIADLKKVTVYDGYDRENVTITMLWEVLQDFSVNLQRLFLSFVSGSDRVPVGGMQEMTLKISKSPRINMLPAAFTCFNQLILPAYTDKKLLKLKLLIAMENSEGFGLQ